MANAYAYMRISTKEDREKQRFSRQENALARYAKDNGIEYVYGYKKYIDLMNKGLNLVFLDNPTVSTDYIKNLLNIAEQQEIVTKTVMESMVKILLIAELDRAEKERKFLSQRTKDGMKARKEEAERQGREWRAGRKPGQLDKMTDELKADIEIYLADRSVKVSDLMRKHNISRNTFKKYADKVKESAMNK